MRSLQREADLAEVARRYLKGESQAEIGDALGKDQSTISRDIRTLHRRWRASAIQDFDTKRAEQLAKIDELERTYWEAWKNSLTRQVTISEKREGKADESRALIRRESRDGNPSFLEGVFRCIDRRCKLLGLDAPSRLEHSGPGGAPIVTTVVVEVPAGEHEEAPDGTVDGQRERGVEA